ncbi:MAG: hypothetical protein LC115_06895 [Bacteroidia bacterium]|nr:hypothetical protein [Bacteroidia bacterium]
MFTAKTNPSAKCIPITTLCMPVILMKLLFMYLGQI